MTDRGADADADAASVSTPQATDPDTAGVVKVVPGPPLSRESPFYRGFFWTLGALGAVLVALAVREIAAVLTLVLIAGFLAVAFEPVVGFVGRRGLARHWSVLVIALLSVFVLGAIVYVLGTTLRAQAMAFVDNAPSLLDRLRENRTVARLDSRYGILQTIQNGITDPAVTRRAAGGVLGLGISVFSAIANTVIVFVLMLYFLAALPTIKSAVYSLAPASRRPRVAALGDEILLRVGRYAIGAAVVALVAGSVTAIFCVAVGLGEYALPLAVLVALLDLVPLVGAILGAASVCLVGFATSLPIGVICVVFYVIYEALEGYVIYPRVMRSSVDVPEYVTIIAVLVGGAVAGIVGALLALPVAAAMILLVREVWVRRQDTV